MAGDRFRDTLDKLRERGYWRVDIHPATVQEGLIPSLAMCEKIMQTAVVLVRGWDYPHVPAVNDEKKQEMYRKAALVESWVDSGCLKEVWRLYQTGQFVHLFAMHEDWYGDDPWFAGSRYAGIEPRSILDMPGAVYRATEVFLLLRNLAAAVPYDTGVSVEVALHGTRGRILAAPDNTRVPFVRRYECHEEKIPLPNPLELPGHGPDTVEENAVVALRSLFELFGWDPSEQSLVSDIRRLMERRV